MTKQSRSQQNFFNMDLASDDPAVFKAIQSELGRQRDQIELIASENIASPAVMAAQGSVMTNKYAEGYSARRYYTNSSVILGFNCKHSYQKNFELSQELRYRQRDHSFVLLLNQMGKIFYGHIFS